MHCLVKQDTPLAAYLMCADPVYKGDDPVDPLVPRHYHDGDVFTQVPEKDDTYLVSVVCACGNICEVTSRECEFAKAAGKPVTCEMCRIPDVDPHDKRPAQPDDDTDDPVDALKALLPDAPTNAPGAAPAPATPPMMPGPSAALTPPPQVQAPGAAPVAVLDGVRIDDEHMADVLNYKSVLPVRLLRRETGLLPYTGDNRVVQNRSTEVLPSHIRYEKVQYDRQFHWSQPLSTMFSYVKHYACGLFQIAKPAARVGLACAVAGFLASKVKAAAPLAKFGYACSVVAALKATHDICTAVYAPPVEVSYVPHVVSAVMNDFPCATPDADVVANLRTKMRRLTRLPIPDYEHTTLFLGNEMVAEALLVNQRQLLNSGRGLPMQLDAHIPADRTFSPTVTALVRPLYQGPVQNQLIQPALPPMFEINVVAITAVCLLVLCPALLLSQLMVMIRRPLSMHLITASIGALLPYVSLVDCGSSFGTGYVPTFLTWTRSLLSSGWRALHTVMPASWSSSVFMTSSVVGPL
jgi:hypothetical protein